jgi:hypothetical protein
MNINNFRFKVNFIIDIHLSMSCAMYHPIGRNCALKWKTSDYYSFTISTLRGVTGREYHKNFNMCGVKLT